MLAVCTEYTIGLRNSLQTKPSPIAITELFRLFDICNVWRTELPKRMKKPIVYTGNKNTTGSSNVFIVNQAGRLNTTASSNVFIGNQAGYSNSEGQFNTYLGYKSAFFAGFKAAADPSYNTYIGFETGYNIEEGDNNTFIGYQSGYGPADRLSTTGSNNTA